MINSKTNIFVVGGSRTPIGTYCGKLKEFTPTQLGVVAAKVALRNCKIPSDQVDHVIFGNAFQTAHDSCHMARHIGIGAGLPLHVPALTVNRLCGGGLEAMIQGIHQILAGDSKIVLAGGAESCSQAPYVIRNMRFGIDKSKRFNTGPTNTSIRFVDAFESLYDSHAKMNMGQTADEVARLFNVTREEADDYARRSHRLYQEANKAHFFDAEISPVEIPYREAFGDMPNVAEEYFCEDEHPKFCFPDKFSRLPPAFARDGKFGVCTAGNSSHLCDGAAAVIIADEESVIRHDVQPIMRIVAWDIIGCEPSIMGIAPVFSINNLVRKSGIPLEKIDLFEINEAFATQIVAIQREMNIDYSRLNVNGGAIAVGHPLATSSIRIAIHLGGELRRRAAKYGIAAASIGGGQGIAILFESIPTI